MTGEGITVRRCRSGDLPAVLDLWERSRSERASTADRLDDVERLVGDSPAALLVAERNGEIVGALIAACATSLTPAASAASVSDQPCSRTRLTNRVGLPGRSLKAL